MIEGSTTPTTFQFAGQRQESGLGYTFTNQDGTTAH